jgi:hypothetical protein
MIIRYVLNPEEIMKRGRRPQGRRSDQHGRASGALPQGTAAGTPKVGYRSAADWCSGPQRWHEAVAELVELQGEYRDMLHTLPPSLEGSATAEALRAVCNLDLAKLKGAKPPRGFRARLIPGPPGTRVSDRGVENVMATAALRGQAHSHF